ncbi:uncharacterized protein LOC110719519 [Chenopodium quinoa]|uniref:uncharacterized protein LOC110719519 n=1 Tax=Chenopodium quinoa TaxID=63459 RepID=UPI000B77A753|nr:uncharacterized protein LOC110719519 [Chenopodium quinoa]
MVGDLIDYDAMCWNVEAVGANFGVEDCNKILNIPLPNIAVYDRRFWWPTSDGLFTVVRPIGLVDWGARMHGIYTMARRGMTFGRETVIHSIFYCKYAIAIWQQSEFRNLIDEAPTDSFREMLMWVASKLDKVQLLLFSCLAWAAWSCRNKAVFENVRDLNSVWVASGYVRMCEDYGTYNAKVGGRVVVADIPSRASWSAPRRGCVKVNFDAYVPDNGTVRLGVVVRDDSGSLLLVAVRNTGCVWPSEMAEAATARYGIEIARRMGYEKVVLEGDAINVVRAIKTKQEGAATIFLLYDDIHRMSSFFSYFACNHIRRAGNTVAHYAARWDPGSSNERVCMSLFPQSFQTLADLDL